MQTRFCVPDVLNEKEQKRIYQSALKILAEVPLTADGTDEFNQALLEFGCGVDGKKIYFPRPVVDRLLDRIKEHKARQYSTPQTGPADRITPYISGQGSLITGTEDDRIRDTTVKDLADLARFVDALYEEVGWCHPTFIPQDKPIKTREVHAFAVICMNHSKPSRVSPYSAQAVKYMADILKVSLGSMEKVRQNSDLIAHKLWINTPFLIGRETIEGALSSRELLGHKIGITIMPVAGASTPITAPGCLALISAEVLAANILSLALDDSLAGFCSSPLTMDLKVGAHIEQDPYTDLLWIGAAQMGSYIFGRSTNLGAFAPRTAAKVPGAQSMMEKTLGAFWHMLGGGRGFNSVGTLSDGDTASFVQILLDLELTGYLNRVLQGLNCEGDDRLAEDVNLEFIPQGARFMESMHTFEFFKHEQWYPQFLDRQVAQAWREDPKTMVENTRGKAIELIRTAPNLSPLSEYQKQEIDSILEEADREPLK